MARASQLSPFARLAWMLVVVLLGLVPSLAFFVWVERNARLPFLGPGLGWPWLSLGGWPIVGLAAWDAGLVLAFGTIHSLLAQRGAQESLSRAVPAQAVRSLYLAVTGASLVVLMGCWQDLHVVVWRLPVAPTILDALSLAGFWGFMAASGWVMQRFGALDFVGLRQLMSRAPSSGRPGPPAPLMTTGLYGRVRHPIYTFTVLAFLVTPFMSLDRLVLLAAMGLYLVFGIPMEERKLVATFGAAYETYRTRVPPVFPRIF